MIHRTQIKNFGEFVLPDPPYGDLKLSLFPFELGTGHQRNELILKS